ncbi:MAG: molybdopterin-binding protein, partial [Solirubrobacteraceae bacterium]|nr:molybdopterin-binding protein [Solirubrobacteraceae bacterium]
LDATVAAIAGGTAPLVVTTGGTGQSLADHVRPALRALGARFAVDGVAMRPGGPTRVAELPDGRLVVCLPGNPLAAMLAAVAIAEPVIAALAGRAARSGTVVSGLDLPGRAGTTQLVPYATTTHGTEAVRWRDSAMMRGLAEADGILVVPETGLRRGEPAVHLDLPWR